MAVIYASYSSRVEGEAIKVSIHSSWLWASYQGSRQILSRRQSAPTKQCTPDNSTLRYVRISPIFQCVIKIAGLASRDLPILVCCGFFEDCCWFFWGGVCTNNIDFTGTQRTWYVYQPVDGQLGIFVTWRSKYYTRLHSKPTVARWLASNSLQPYLSKPVGLFHFQQLLGNCLQGRDHTYHHQIIWSHTCSSQSHIRACVVICRCLKEFECFPFAGEKNSCF